MFRFYKFPKWCKGFYPEAIWDFFLNKNDKVIYLTFDDGPNPTTTNWILEELDRVDAKATFFCVGEQVKKNPALFSDILKNKHNVGNHSMTHINGFKTKYENYVKDVESASQYIKSKMFRPPYGKITPKQYKKLVELGYRIVFWSYISYDFDASLKSATRINKILDHVKNGSIIVFHDSKKAYPQLKKELPFILEQLKQKGFRFKTIQ